MKTTIYDQLVSDVEKGTRTTPYQIKKAKRVRKVGSVKRIFRDILIFWPLAGLIFMLVGVFTSPAPNAILGQPYCTKAPSVNCPQKAVIVSVTPATKDYFTTLTFKTQFGQIVSHTYSVNPLSPKQLAKQDGAVAYFDDPSWAPGADKLPVGGTVALVVNGNDIVGLQAANIVHAAESFVWVPQAWIGMVCGFSVLLLLAWLLVFQPDF